MMEPRKNPRKKILVVDDVKEFVDILKEFLEDNGYSVTIVENGFDALSEVLIGQYDLITMDLEMPGLSGLEATELIRLKHHILTPVIVISAYLATENERELRALGVEHFIHKPVDLDLLKEKSM